MKRDTPQLGRLEHLVAFALYPGLGVQASNRTQEAVPGLHPTHGAPASAHAWIPPAGGSTGYRDVQPHVCEPCTQGEASYTLHNPYNHRRTNCDKGNVQGRHVQHTLELPLQGTHQLAANSHIPPAPYGQVQTSTAEAAMPVEIDSPASSCPWAVFRTIQVACIPFL